MKFIGKILPVDGYYVVLNGNLPVDYEKSLTHLYQPLLGLEPVSLYMTLLHDIDLQANSSLQTHHTLMNYLNISLDEIYHARLKLEGIGLLKTYERTSEENNSYIYELISPFSPNDFFMDAMLAELLYHHLGNNKFHSLKAYYANDSPVQLKKEITVSFSEVFQTFEPSFEFQEDVKEPKVRTKQQGPNLEQVDFSGIELMLNQRMIPVKRILTHSNRKLISEMMFLYDLASYEIEKSILWALTEENMLDLEEFKQACHDFFKIKGQGQPIQLTKKKEQPKMEQKKLESLSKEEQLIHHFETMSPKQLLEDLSSGNQASEREMRMIQEIMTRQGLPAPVMNVLVHYVLIQSNMKLSRNYLDAIATHWSRANLTTAKQAMDFAKKQIKEFQTGEGSKQKSNEVIPEWFKDRNKQQKSEKSVEEREKEEEELAALIQQFSENE